jgi:glyoxylase-like metal-dependent hydrolase (beta-lactamase superfamily II)
MALTQSTLTRWRVLTVGATVSAIAMLAGGLGAQGGETTAERLATRARSAPTTNADGLDVLQLRPNFYVIAGAGGNIGVQVGADGVVVVDSGTASRADAVVRAVKSISNRPIRYVINTSADADHVGGNEIVARAGQTILNLTGALSGLTNGGAAAVLAAESVLRRMSAPTGETAPFPTAAWPTETFHGRRSYMYLNGEAIETLHQPAAHSDGDSLVFFRRSDIVMAGDVIDTNRFPVIDLTRGGGIQGEIDALNRLVELAVPSFPLVWQEGGTYVVPGHGRVYEQLDVVEYRDMVTVIRDRVRALIDEGRTLDQVKAAQPAQGYSRQYGSDNGPWRTDMFIEAVYASLKQGSRQSP